MKYLGRSFTMPASNNASQKEWDRAFLTARQFLKKYGESAEQDNECGDERKRT